MQKVMDLEAKKGVQSIFSSVIIAIVFFKNTKLTLNLCMLKINSKYNLLIFKFLNVIYI